MFILNITYKKPIEEVEKFLASHIAFLDKYYTLKKFMCSGRKIPRNGGIILCLAENLQEVNSIITEDPFYSEGIADYEVIEFMPTKFNEALEEVICNK